jgi:hypothetical protein
MMNCHNLPGQLSIVFTFNRRMKLAIREAEDGLFIASLEERG